MGSGESEKFFKNKSLFNQLKPVKNYKSSVIRKMARNSFWETKPKGKKRYYHHKTEITDSDGMCLFI